MNCICAKFGSVLWSFSLVFVRFLVAPFSSVHSCFFSVSVFVTVSSRSSCPAAQRPSGSTTGAKCSGTKRAHLSGACCGCSWLVLAAAGFVAWRREARVAAADLFFLFFSKKMFAECPTKNTRQRRFAVKKFTECRLPSVTLGKRFAECFWLSRSVF